VVKLLGTESSSHPYKKTSFLIGVGPEMIISHQPGRSFFHGMVLYHRVSGARAVVPGVAYVCPKTDQDRRRQNPPSFGSGGENSRRYHEMVYPRQKEGLVFLHGTVAHCNKAWLKFVAVLVTISDNVATIKGDRPFTVGEKILSSWIFSGNLEADNSIFFDYNSTVARGDSFLQRVFDASKREMENGDEWAIQSVSTNYLTTYFSF